MKYIYVLKGCGYGNSIKSALDSALSSIGLENANIIEISSIIPEGVEGIKEIEKYKLKKYGNKIYALVSYKVDREKAVAGLGILYDKKKKKGIILEASGENKEKVLEELREGIKDMLEYRDLNGNLEYYICEGINNSNKKYVCSLVIAVYKEEEWWKYYLS